MTIAGASTLSVAGCLSSDDSDGEDPLGSEYGPAGVTVNGIEDADAYAEALTSAMKDQRFFSLEEPFGTELPSGTFSTVYIDVQEERYYGAYEGRYAYYGEGSERYLYDAETETVTKPKEGPFILGATSPIYPEILQHLEVEKPSQFLMDGDKLFETAEVHTFPITGVADEFINSHSDIEEIRLTVAGIDSQMQIRKNGMLSRLSVAGEAKRPSGDWEPFFLGSGPRPADEATVTEALPDRTPDWV